MRAITKKCCLCQDGLIPLQGRDDNGDFVYYNNDNTIFCESCLKKLSKLIKDKETDT